MRLIARAALWLCLAFGSGLLLHVLAAAGPAAAQQQQPEAADLARRLAVVEAQRNVILGWHTASEAARAGLAEELARAQARIKELEPKPETPKE